MSTLFIVVSKTQLSLWENKVPDIIYKTIKEENNIKTRKEVEKLSRHHFAVINTFCSLYGEYLERCEYATIKGLPVEFEHFYTIVQVPIYGSSLNPEMIEVKVEECLTYYKNVNPNPEVYKEVKQFIVTNTTRCKLCFMYSGNVVPPMTPSFG